VAQLVLPLEGHYGAALAKVDYQPGDARARIETEKADRGWSRARLRRAQIEVIKRIRIWEHGHPVVLPFGWKPTPIGGSSFAIKASEVIVGVH